MAAYMQLSDAVFTPYAESLYPSSGGGGGEASRSSGWRIVSTIWSMRGGGIVG